MKKKRMNEPSQSHVVVATQTVGRQYLVGHALTTRATAVSITSTVQHPPSFPLPRTKNNRIIFLPSDVWHKVLFRRTSGPSLELTVQILCGIPLTVTCDLGFSAFCYLF